MSFRTRTAVAITAVALVALSGCAPEPPPIVPEPTSTTPPLFASDEEALAAAEEAYREYLRVSDAIATDGGRDVERLEGLVTEELLGEEIENYAVYLDRGISVSGVTIFDVYELQQLVDNGDGSGLITLYACTDISQTKVLNAEGEDVTPNRKLILPVEIEIIVSDTKPKMLVQSTSQWSGENFCEN